MAEKKKDYIDLSECILYNPEDLKCELRAVRALIVGLLGYAPEVNPKQVANALYTLQYLTEEVEYK